MTDNHACDSDNIIRPSHSSLLNAPSWSSGVGARNEEESQNREKLDHNSYLTNSNATPCTSSTQATNYDPCPRISLSIPTVYLTKKDSNSSSYHVYKLNIRASTGVEWTIYRRYSQFYALHHQLKSKDPIISKFQFPPKRRLNSKASTIVQDRRQRLEDYIRILSNYITTLPSSGIEQPLQQVPISELGPTTIRDRSSFDTNSLSDSANSDVNRNEVPVIQSDLGSGHKSDELGVRSLFLNFISFQDQKDEDFDPL